DPRRAVPEAAERSGDALYPGTCAVLGRRPRDDSEPAGGDRRRGPGTRGGRERPGDRAAQDPLPVSAADPLYVDDAAARDGPAGPGTVRDPPGRLEPRGRPSGAAA